MHRPNPMQTSTSRWQSYEGMPVSGSLIVGHTALSPKNYPSNHKSKFDQFGLKQNQFIRHQSEKQFTRVDCPKPYLFSQSPQPNFRGEQEIGTGYDRIRSSQIYTKRNGNFKMTQQTQGYFKPRGSGGKANNALKQTSSTSNSNEGLSNCKSERTFPSFLRAQTKSPSKFKTTGKEGLGKQNFKFIKKLGEGKFGSVYLAREMMTGMIVGLKMVQKKRIIKDNFIVQFIRQLKIQIFLDHPNIIKVLGYFHDEDHVYIVLQLGCDGQLFDIISNGSTLSQETTSFIIGNLLDALQLMHKNKILHRDIKPENIVLVHGNIKLCDFGWAVNKKEELRSTFCGTPLYLSPELLQGSRYDEKVDLWAVGVLAYELFYGKSPFNINQHEDLVKIVTDQVEFSTTKPISKEFKEFLTAILKKNPKERLECRQLLGLQFIKKYRQLQTCEQLCH